MRQDIPVPFNGSTEAEAIKLFANTWLAMRVACFNELDTDTATHGLDSPEVVDICRLIMTSVKDKSKPEGSAPWAISWLS